MPSSQATPPFPAEGEQLNDLGWPTDTGPFVALLDVSSKLEYDTLKEWIAGHGPQDERVVTVRIPASRRITQQRLDPRLGARLAANDDPLLIPLRVVWLPAEERGRRRVRIRDIVVFGDPRDPNRLRQQWVKTRYPDRLRVVMGEPARKSALDKRWRDPGGHGPADGTPLEDYVALQAWLALERAERRLRGSRYKVPKFIGEDLYWRRGFQHGVAALAMAEGASLKRMQARTSRYLREIAATHSPYVIDIAVAIMGGIIRMAHRSVDYRPDELRAIYEMGQRHSLVFLPSHKSNFDHLVLSFVMYENALPQNHTAGGINMNFFPIGPLLRRTGIFFIRREFKDNEPYKFVLRRYVEYLLEKRFALEWYVEGGRSRTGKLREPRLGLLAYVAEAYTEGLVDDVVLIPVSLMYDQISDVRSYAAEQVGGAKERESFAWALKFISNSRHQHGGIYVRFGTPIRLAERLAPGMDLSTGDGRLAVPRLAFAVNNEINAVMPITPVSLASLALLGSGLPMTVGDVMAYLEPYLAYIKWRDLPTSAPLAADTVDLFARALAELSANGVIERSTAPDEATYTVGAGAHLAVAYYRNAVVHHFLDRAIAEVAFASAVAVGEDGFDAVFAHALGMRDLLKFEFFFAPRSTFRKDIERETGHLEPQEPAMSPAVLRPFLDAYRVAADVLVAATGQRMAPQELTQRALNVSARYLKDGVIVPEARSTSLFDSAAQLAAHRGLLSAHSDGRNDLADEVSWLLQRVAEFPVDHGA
jgi:glycerol-3-phosphate O-acyltransferase